MHTYPPAQDEGRIEQIIHSLEHYALGDVKKASEQGLLVAAFILAACFIDQMAHHRYYRIIRGSSSEKFIAFVNAYFEGKYDGNILCNDLRSRMVHNYSVTENFSLTKGRPDWHLLTDHQGITCLNIDEFISEIERALDKLKGQMRSPGEIRKAALGHYAKYDVIRQKQ